MDPTVPETSIGTEEGSKCNRDGCNGEIKVELDGECWCHINPPCSACTNSKLICSECYFTIE